MLFSDLASAFKELVGKSPVKKNKAKNISNGLPPELRVLEYNPGNQHYQVSLEDKIESSYENQSLPYPDSRQQTHVQILMNLYFFMYSIKCES